MLLFVAMGSFLGRLGLLLNGSLFDLNDRRSIHMILAYTFVLGRVHFLSGAVLAAFANAEFSAKDS